ncbi:MAG: acetate kinase [Betaproteobacteria bacterium]|nr:acetate kinase [Betaproteobacteria bacterium]
MPGSHPCAKACRCLASLLLLPAAFALPGVASAASPSTGPAPQDTPPPKVAPIFEQPGVLTPVGKWVVDPTFQYAYSSSNQVSIIGYTIIPAIAIGSINVYTVHSNTSTFTLATRYGLTNRAEIELDIPYVYRNQSVLSRPIANGSGGTLNTYYATGSHLGDVSVTGRYQFNQGSADWPYFIGTLKLKSRTGIGPYEVPIDPTTKLQTSLPTGSGFYGIEPGITALYASDPAVFFGSFNYLYSFKRHIGVQNGIDYGDVTPGAAVEWNFGMGMAINERASFSLGYDGVWIGRTTQVGQPSSGTLSTQLGTLLLGYSYATSRTSYLNIAVGAGLTRDTPDVTLTVQLPMTF